MTDQRELLKERIAKTRCSHFHDGVCTTHDLCVNDAEAVLAVLEPAELDWTAAKEIVDEWDFNMAPGGNRTMLLNDAAKAEMVGQIVDAALSGLVVLKASEVQK